MQQEDNQSIFTGDLLIPSIKRAVAAMGFTLTTPVQQQVIPAFLQGQDLIVQAPTGTGKTAAFGIPIAQLTDSRKQGAQALILSPTRELAIQTAQVLQKLAQYQKGLRIATLYGGEPIARQLSALRARPQIIVATPGRLIDHIQRRSVSLSAVRIVVLDEADRMLDMGFQDELNRVLASVPAIHQTVLFSATLPGGILDIAANYQREAKHITIKQDTLTVKSVKQFYTTVNQGAKQNELMSLLKEAKPRLCLVFVNTKRMADSLCEDLQGKNLRADVLHGDINQQKRERIMKAFRTGRIDILVATDVAARGIDVRNIDLVVNYDLPIDSESYVHRIGRTGRAERAGTAHTLIYRREIRKLNAIITDTKASIQRMNPGLAAAV